MITPDQPSLPDPDAGGANLLVRRVGRLAADLLAAAVPDCVADPREVAAWVADGGAFVLGDVAGGPLDAADATALFSLDTATRTALLRYVTVREGRRGCGLGRRVVTDAVVLLRAAGFEVVEAQAPDVATQRFLGAVGFQYQNRSQNLLYWC